MSLLFLDLHSVLSSESIFFPPMLLITPHSTKGIVNIYGYCGLNWVPHSFVDGLTLSSS